MCKSLCDVGICSTIATHRTVEPHLARNRNRSQQARTVDEVPKNILMGTEKDPHPSQQTTHLLQVLPPEVILETQFYTSKNTKGNIYNDILVSIRLDSPTKSQNTKDTMALIKLN